MRATVVDYEVARVGMKDGDAQAGVHLDDVGTAGRHICTIDVKWFFLQRVRRYPHSLACRQSL